MPLDHFVSQVHLKNFYSPKLGELMYCVRKQDMKAFQCRSEDICRIQEGSTNKYLKEERAIEEFLKNIEPKYNGAIEKLRKGEVDKDAAYVIAGFVAYVATCSPAAIRINTGPLQSGLEATMELLDKMGKLPEPPATLGGKSATELLSEGKIGFKVDEKFPQAIGIQDIEGRVAAFGNAKWDVIINDAPEHPFFTSDFPVVIECTSNPGVSNRVVPLAPDLAVRIMPDPARPRDKSLTGFEFGMMRLKQYGVHCINRMIVQGAESLVFYRDDAEWVKSFVERYKGFRIESTKEKILTEEGVMIFMRQKLVENSADC